ncbi:hypothetical protein [Streptomyces sp. NPDC000878]
MRIRRRFEEWGKPEEREEPGRKLKQISRRPAYTDLGTRVVPVPAGFARSDPVTVVLAGSIAEKECPDCDAGWLACDTCKRSGTQKCPETVKCPGCRGGTDACWSCGGTGKKGHRKPPPKGQRKARTTCCRRCGEHDMACPECFGEQTKQCPLCNGTGNRSCDDCNGNKRVKHKRCEATGYLTTFTAVVIKHPVVPDPKRILPPAHLWWQTRRAGWRQEILTSPAAELPADLPETLRPEVERRLAFAKREVLREATLRFLPVARVEVVGDPEWVYFAFPERPGTGGGLKVVRRPARQRLVRLAAIASTAVVIAVLVTWLAMTATS